MKKLGWLLTGLLISSTLLAQTAGDYRSRQTGNWNTVTTWEVFNGGVWNNLEDAGAGAFQNITPTSASGVITLTAGFGVTVPAGSLTVDQVFVEAFAELAVSGTLTIANGALNDLEFYNDGIDYGLLNVNSGGIIVLSDLAVIVGTDQANANFSAGSIYRHLYTNTEGSIPVANWATTSRVEINGYTLSANINATAGGNWSQTFGDFHFNSPISNSARIFNFMGLLTDIAGELRIISTGVGRINLGDVQTYTLNVGSAVPADLSILGTSRVVFNTTGALTLNISRDMIFNSTLAAGSNTNSSGTTVINIARDFLMNASGGQLVLASGAAAGSGTLNISRNFTLTAGTLTETSTATGVGVLNFNGSTSATFTNSGSITNTVNYTIASLKTLDLGTSAMTGAGSFTLHGVMRVGSTDAGGALQTGSAGGNLRVTGARSFNPSSTNATVVYSGSAGQFIGNGFPSGSNVNLTISNANHVTLSDNLDVVSLSTLALTSGNIIIGAQTLTINGTVSGSGGITGGPTSNLTIGGTGSLGTLTFAGSNQLLNFTLNRTSSGLVTLGGDLTVIGTLTQSAGDISLNGNDLTVSGAFVRTAGNIVVHSASALVFDGSGSMPASVGLSGTTLNTLTLDRNAATLTSGASITVTNLNLLDGTFANGAGFAIASGGTITRDAGSMSTSPTSSGTYNILYDVSGTISSGLEFSSVVTRIQNVTMDGGGTVNLSANRTINGNFTLTSGDFNIGANTLTLEGNLIANSSSTFTGGTILFDGVTTISGSAIPTFGNIQVNDTRTLTLPAGDFDVAGHIAFDAGAIVNAGSSTIVLTGGLSPQNFSGGGVTVTNVTVDKTGGTDVDLTSQLIITGALEVSSANSDFGSNGNLIIRSTSDGTTNNGRIGQLLGGATVSGDVVVERFMAAEGRIYRYISAPVTGFTVAELQLEFPVTGSFTGTSVCGTCLTNQSMFSYNGATQAYVDFPANDNSEELLPGVGYSAFVRQDVIGGPATIDWTGPINQGTVPLPVSHNGTASSFNLVGNPYPSTIDWDNAGWTKTGIAASIQVRDNSTGIFQTWNGSTGGLTGGRIATGQAFWVRTTAGSPVLQVTEPVKSTTTGTFFKVGEDEELNQFVLTLSDGVVEDNAYFWVSDVASPGQDDFDAIKMNNFRNTGSVPLMDLGTFSYGADAVAMAINSVDKINCSDTVRVYTNDLTAGTYTFTFNASGTVQELTWILRDKFLNTAVNVSENSVYQFTVTADANSKAVERFDLVISYNPVEISTSGNTLISSYESGNQWYYNGELLENETGQELMAEESGMYTLVTTTGGCATSADIQFIVTGLERPWTEEIQIYPNPVKNKLNLVVESAIPVYTRIYNALGLVVAEKSLEGSGVTKSGEIDLSGNAAGIYILHIQKGNETHQVKIIKSN